MEEAKEDNNEKLFLKKDRNCLKCGLIPDPTVR